jgi:hypothetical protein
MAWLAPVEGMTSASSTCRRILVAPGVEVLMDEQHPALRLNSDPSVIAEAIRHALATVVGLEPSLAISGEPGAGAESTWGSMQQEPEMADTPMGTERPG